MRLARIMAGVSASVQGAGPVERVRETPRYPDFFIVGAPRSGTTFMYEYLRLHPQIFMSPAKEPQHFATDLDSGSYLDSVTFLRDRRRYLELFAAARPDQLLGEGSTWYLYSQAAAGNIQAVRPDARIVIMLRDPVEMLYSLHGRRVYGGSEDLASFEEALAAEEDRKQGRRMPARPRNVKALFYREVARYHEQVKRYLDIFGQGQVHVIIFDDFRADPAGMYRGLLEFLGVDASFNPDFRVINESAERRSWRVQQLLLSPRVVRLARAIIPLRFRPAVGRAWDALNSKGKSRQPLSDDVAAALYSDLRDDIDQLGQLIGRDLLKLWGRSA